MDVKEIGNRIKQARTLRNLTLNDIASEIGVAKSTIQRYENGRISKPKLPVLQAIADSLRVNPAWLSGESVPMEKENKWLSIKKYIDKTDAFEAQLKHLGWTCEFIDCNTWNLIESGMGYDDNGNMIDDEKGRPVGCSLPNRAYTKCEDCVYRHPHYRFSNGSLSFDVSIKEYDSFCNDTELFYKKRLQKLLLKSSKHIFVNETELNAAQARKDIELPDDTDTSDNDIMDDPNF